MFRWAFNILALASLLLCAVTVVFWARSHSGGDLYAHYYDPKVIAGWVVESTDGNVFFAQGSTQPDFLEFVDEPLLDLGQSFDWDLERFAPVIPGVNIEQFSTWEWEFWCICVSYYWLVYLFNGLPILWCFSFYRRVRYQRRCRMNHCGACGYNLRGGGDACPECGVKKMPSPERVKTGEGKKVESLDDSR